ncbi:3-deoxy-manno-octulosonate cytidylyltransferase [Roseomonas stagni]|uniref:3-deoxy-manno-octulosonate cytidylyltransferase n=1 Tax=Falsiroseomonas algicola TaxID=2716930 RepID=A0A6M1LEB0_9PROT|nr:3-deoxy-manno-octulosonate cytidylyltransferase [Falsiroseomonas algicola]NGM18502.1 3-deoxy-manno-octulosonate cytidylyltransferase [Falsiroseomonas algicola]
MRVVAVIPARYGSSRFEGKPLADIAGAPMIAWVYQAVRRSTLLADVVVATDDERIAKVCEARGLNYVMTSSAHETSTERLNEVAARFPADLYLCVNGDEPLIDHRRLEAIIPAELPAEEIYVANLTCKISKPAEVMDPTNIKVVWDANHRAVFFSRSPIPFPKSSLSFDYYKHIGVLIYNKAALNFFATTRKGAIEQAEDINELRFVENGVGLKMVVVEPSEALSVDTPKDLERVREIVRERKLQAP